MKVILSLTMIIILTICMLFASENTIKVGLIGLDTSHAPAFTRFLNTPDDENYVAGAKVVAAFAGGSPEVEASYTRVDEYTRKIRDEYDVEIVATIEELLEKVDAIILTSVDGNVHLEQARPVILAKKRIYIDKPMAASLEDIYNIFNLAEEHQVPCWSASSLRYYPELQEAIRDTAMGRILGCEAFSPAHLEPHHPDLFWYGVHGVEILMTVMGPEVKKVSRVYTEEFDLVTGVWDDGRIGTFRGSRTGKGKYGATIFYENGVKHVIPGPASLYKPLLEEIVNFFRTGVVPVRKEDTIAIFKFMDAAQKSREKDGKQITIN